jgi:hypothetical protein
MSEVEADSDAAGDYPQNATGLPFGSTVDLILTNYARRKISPNLSYVGEIREGKTKGGEGNRKVQGLIGFFPYVISFGGFSTLLLPRLAGWPTSVRNG